MGRYAAGEAPEMDRLVEDAVVRIGAEIEALAVPRLQGVVLGGGYGRGEGGVFELPDGSRRLSNDLDFFAITEEGASGRDIRAVADALAPLAAKWTATLGVDVDFVVRTPWRMRHDQERVMIQELLRGYVDVAGEKGEGLFARVERREPRDIPWSEAARQLMNRGMGLMLAAEPGRSQTFVVRNINKCILGAGDASLIARGAYAWRAEDRAAALGEDVYSAAVEWKFRPREEPVCNWERAREEWLGAKTEVYAAADEGGFRRTLRNAARWVVRRRSVGEISTFGMDPVVRVLDGIAKCIETREAPSASLRRDWEVFN